MRCEMNYKFYQHQQMHHSMCCALEY
jgi:hypothetical protein